MAYLTDIFQFALGKTSIANRTLYLKKINIP
jgi:hypothetical protein